jgi:glycosyltransferase involved in cell wall biosynthesis
MRTKTKPKIIIIIPCWGRANVLKVVSNQLNVFCATNAAKINTTVLFILSPEDKDLKKHLRILEKANYTNEIIYTPNEWLGQKLNEGVEWAVKEGCDYIMNMGSDDLIHPAIINLYMPLIKKKCPLFGLNKLYFWDVSGNALHFSYYNNPHIVGAGRMIHLNAVKNVIERTGALYDKNINRCLDGNSATRMIACGYNQLTLDPGKFPMIVDIKCGVNINSYKVIKNSLNRNGITNFDGKFLESVYPALKKIKMK